MGSSWAAAFDDGPSRRRQPRGSTASTNARGAWETTPPPADEILGEFVGAEVDDAEGEEDAPPF